MIIYKTNYDRIMEHKYQRFLEFVCQLTNWYDLVIDRIPTPIRPD